jgi:threonine/homoserine/homoserine lactone efflux protein
LPDRRSSSLRHRSTPSPIVVIHLFWLWFGVGLAQLLVDPRRSRIANILFALILVGTVALAAVR